MKTFLQAHVTRFLLGALCALALTFAIAGSTRAASAASVAMPTASTGNCYNLSNGYVDHHYFAYGYANGPGGYVGYGYSVASGYPFNDFWVYSCAQTPGFDGPGDTPLWR